MADFSLLSKFPQITSADIHSDLAWSQIRDIGKESSRLGKIELLKEGDYPFFKWVLKQVFDNTIVFGLKIKREEREALEAKCTEGEFTIQEVSFLTLLASGKYTRAEAMTRLEELAEHLSVDSMRFMIAIINKNIDAGINSSTINKVFKGLIPTYPYMRCSLPTQVNFDELTWEVGVYAQEKADGMFNNINVSKAGEVTILSRQGTMIPTDKLGEGFKHLTTALSSGYQYHGEMLIRDPKGKICPREIGNGIINSVCKGGDIPEGYTVFWQLWDMIPLYAAVAKGKYTEPYSFRFEKLLEELKGYASVVPITTSVVYSLAEAKAFYRKMLAEGKEGAVLKNSTAIWRDGTSKEQVKMKLVLDCDLIVKGFEEGQGKFEHNLGSLICESKDGQLVTNISGFGDELRREIWEHREEYLDKIVTVKFNDVMIKEGQPAALFLPRFVEFREDKEEADDLHRILATQRQAIGG